MINRKGAIELATSTLVTIIISLVILAFGIVFLYNLVYGAESVKLDLDAKLNEELEHLLTDQGKQVALPFQTANLYPGENHVFGVGILNTKEKADFKIDVICKKYVNEERVDETEPVCSIADNWYLYNTETFSLEQGEHRKEGIMVDLPNDASKGEYIFDVKVNREELNSDFTLYGNPQKFYVNVK